MNETLNRYLQILWRTGDHEAAVIDAAEWCRSTSPWRVVEEAGLLARCHVEKATSDISLTADLRVRGAQSKTGVQRIEAGALYPVLQNHGRLKKGAFDTPRKMAREVVRHALHAASGPVRTALDGACGTGTFLVALQEAGVEQIMGSDLDSLALKVAKIAVPKADIRLADALDQGPLVDCVVGNPPFVRPERQTKEVRQAAKARFPWLKGRFDLVVPFAFSASERCRIGGGVGLVLPTSAMVQPYGAPMRRRWVEQHRITQITSARPFPGAAVEVCVVALCVGQGPDVIPPLGLSPESLLQLQNVPLGLPITSSDIALVQAIRQRSVPLKSLCIVDTGVVSHMPGGSREDLLFDSPGRGRVRYADAKEFFSGRHRWLQYDPSRMHRAKHPSMFEKPKIVVQRIRGKGSVRAAIDHSGIYVGHTCTVVQPRESSIDLETVLKVVRSPLMDGLTRIERGIRMDLYPKDVAALPFPTSWLEDTDIPLDEAFALTRSQVARLEHFAG